MSEPHLILHKVRGEPAFDVAIKLTLDRDLECTTAIDDDEVWIIPTSGHRAYPFWSSKLTELHINLLNPTQFITHALTLKLEGHPDHYSCNDRPLKEDVYLVKQRAKGLLENLGLVKKVNVERRF